MKNVIIIEAPGKVNSFKKYVGKNFSVYPTIGHCVDLPVKKLGVNIKKGFEPEWEVKEDSKKTVKEICKACKNADNVYLMTDEDREGEAIAWHIMQQIQDTCKGTIHRASTNQITKAGIQKALENPGVLDLDKINAYLARRMLDRLCGYKTSFLTQQATGGRSAGRVQSAVLRIIADREKEIIHFVPEEYWVLTAYLLTEKGEQYTAVLTDKVKVSNGDDATQIYDACMKSTPVVKKVETKEVDIKPYAPFTTMPMVGACGSLMGWNAARCMKTAQNLYSAGHITYHRTDSPTMAPEAIQEIRAFVSHNFGDNYVPQKPNIYTSKKGAQEAHECCRPTDITAKPKLSGDEQKLYDLIWRRAIASQMTKARDRRLKVITDIGKYDFVSNGKVQLFDGFRKCWTYSTSDDVSLPDLQKGDQPVLKALEKEQKFTSPPNRYTDASLAKLCETKQITRPATVANVFKTLEDRKYVTKKKNTFHPTETGMAVVDFLKKSNMCFVDVEFTADMEDLLDEVQSGSKTEKDILTSFWDRLKGDIENGKKVREESQKTSHKCPLCGGYLLKKHSKFGSFFSCENWKSQTKKQKEAGEEPSGCTYTANIGGDGEPEEKKAAKPKEYADFACKKCKSKMVKRKSKFGEFYGCEKFPQCRATADTEGNFKESKKKWKKNKG